MANIINCADCLRYGIGFVPFPKACSPAKTLGETGLTPLLNRKILRWSSDLGTYGTGGYGFFGMQLKATRDYKSEWLVLTIFAAGSWLLLDNRWLECHPRYYALQQPLYGSKTFDNPGWDELSEKLVGGFITEAVVKDAECTFTIETNGEKHLLELPQDTNRLSWYGGKQTPRTWLPEDNCWNAWVLSRKGILISAS